MRTLRKSAMMKRKRKQHASKLKHRLKADVVVDVVAQAVVVDQPADNVVAHPEAEAHPVAAAKNRLPVEYSLL
jgi:hypothetical protein